MVEFGEVVLGETEGLQSAVLLEKGAQMGQTVGREVVVIEVEELQLHILVVDQILNESLDALFGQTVAPEHQHL